MKRQAMGSRTLSEGAAVGEGPCKLPTQKVPPSGLTAKLQSRQGGLASRQVPSGEAAVAVETGGPVCTKKSSEFSKACWGALAAAPHTRMAEALDVRDAAPWAGPDTGRACVVTVSSPEKGRHKTGPASLLLETQQRVKQPSNGRSSTGRVTVGPQEAMDGRRGLSPPTPHQCLELQDDPVCPLGHAAGAPASAKVNGLSGRKCQEGRQVPHQPMHKKAAPLDTFTLKHSHPHPRATAGGDLCLLERVPKKYVTQCLA